MKLSKKCEYACLILIELARVYDEKGLLTGSVIAEKNHIPRKFFDQIANMLKRKGYIISTRGTFGGYLLAKPPSRINMAEIIRMIDGAIAPVSAASEFFYKNSPSEQNEKLIACFRDIRDYAAQKLEQLTFDMLV
ncbi:MAG: Rrf2 family transcriptional regulator [Lachnospiraceae bacterium]|jgi:Rrf2 family protein|nr:Rrf2 family transcriptional regulator [Lachnospiraceae bacterium]